MAWEMIAMSLASGWSILEKGKSLAGTKIEWMRIDLRISQYNKDKIYETTDLGNVIPEATPQSHSHVQALSEPRLSGDLFLSVTWYRETCRILLGWWLFSTVQVSTVHMRMCKPVEAHVCIVARKKDPVELELQAVVSCTNGCWELNLYWM